MTIRTPDPNWTPEYAEQMAAEEAAYLAGRAQRAAAAVKAEAAKRILEKYPAWQQINAALGVYDATTVAAMTTYINAVRLASDAIEARLAADPSIDPATAPEWPEMA